MTGQDGRALAYYDGHRWALYEDQWVPLDVSPRAVDLMRASGEREHIEPGLWFLDGSTLVPVTSQTIDRDDQTPLDVNMMLVGSGATYRQIDYWCRRRYLHDDAEGSGSQRTWTLADYVVACLVVRLSTVGIEVEAAVRVAQFAVFNGSAGANLGKDVMVSWDQPE
jgi:hypothetical protein